MLRLSLISFPYSSLPFSPKEKGEVFLLSPPVTRFIVTAGGWAAPGGGRPKGLGKKRGGRGATATSTAASVAAKNKPKKRFGGGTKRGEGEREWVGLEPGKAVAHTQDRERGNKTNSLSWWLIDVGCSSTTHMYVRASPSAAAAGKRGALRIVFLVGKARAPPSRTAVAVRAACLQGPGK